MALDVVTPSGDVVAVDDPALIESLGEGLRGENHLTLVRSDRALTDSAENATTAASARHTNGA